MDSAPAEGDSGEADDPVPDALPARFEQHLGVAGALDDDVGLGGRTAQFPAVRVGCAESADHVGLAALGHQIQDIRVVAALDRQQGGEQADRAGARDEHRLWRPGRPAADLLDVVPGLGDHGGRLEQHAQLSQRRADRHQVPGVDAVPLAGVPVAAGYPPFGVAAVQAHVPVPGRARRARIRIGAAHDADDEVTDGEPATGRRRNHPAQRLVPDDQPVLPRRRRPVLAVDDLQVGPADAHRLGLDKDGTVPLRRLRHLAEGDGALLFRDDGYRAHPLTVQRAARHITRRR